MYSGLTVNNNIKNKLNIGTSSTKTTTATANKSKSSKYRQIATNLTTLASDKVTDAAAKDKTSSIMQGVMTGAGTILGGIIPGVGGVVVGGIASLLGGLIGLSNGDKEREEAQRYTNMAQEITGYMESLTERDTTILNTMDQISSSMDSLRGTYGSAFVDTMYNYYLAKSGMTSDAYSMLTGNVNTFENIGVGTVSEENGMFDSLTMSNQDLFNNIYAQLQLEDIKANQSLLDTMVQALYNGDTEMGLNLKGYENELKTMFGSTAIQQSSMIFNAQGQLVENNAQNRSEMIQGAENIGSAEASQATSGVRGGTTSNNANLARLSRDLVQIQRTAQIGAIIGSLRYNLMNSQLNASSTAFSYRNAEQRMISGALNNAVASFNSVGRTGRAGERSANYSISEAQEYERQFKKNYSESSENDKERIQASLGR